ncbi:MAG: substrate-binding domain-containing protein [Alphaproteobacteria bacterium]
MDNFAEKSRRAFVAAAIAITGTIGVWSASEQAQAQSLALVQINQQALFFNQLNDGATAAAKAAGAELVIFNANNDPTAQNNAVETYIAQGVDGIIVVAIDTNGIMPAVIQAANAGIAVVAVDAILGDGPHVSQVGVNNYGAGQDIGKTFLDFVDANKSGSAKIGIVGALNSTIQNVRQKGFEDTIATNANIEVVGVVDGRNVQDNALTAAENLMTANPDMEAIYATGEPALVGAVAAVISQGAQDRIKVFGWDLTAQVIDGIDQGFVEAVVQQDPAGMGAAAVDALLAVIKGGSVPRVTDVPITIVTQDNVEGFRATFQ